MIADIRIPHDDIYSNPLRFLNPQNEPIENHNHRRPSSASSCHLFHPRSKSPKEIINLESKVITLGRTPRRDHPDLCLYRVGTAFWRIKDRGRDVCSGHLLWIGKLFWHVNRHELMYSYTVHSRVIVELYMLNSYHLYVHLPVLSISN
jgi:hypothetical protein